MPEELTLEMLDEAVESIGRQYPEGNWVVVPEAWRERLTEGISEEMLEAMHIRFSVYIGQAMELKDDA